MEDRAAAGGDGVDMHHRRPHPDAGDHGLETALVVAGVMGDIGRGAAHVETDQAAATGPKRGLHHPHHPAGRPRQHRIAAAEAGGGGQAAVRLHELQAGRGPGGAEPGRHPVDVAAQQRGQVGVDDGGVAAGHQLDQRTDPVADRDVGEAGRRRQRGGPLLVPGITVAVQQDDRHRGDALAPKAPEIPLQPRFVEGLDDGAVGGDPLPRLDHAGIQHLRQDDAAGEDLGPVLIADLQRVAEALGDHQQGRLAAAFEQGVGGDGGAHPHLGDALTGDGGGGIQPQQRPDAVDGGIRIPLRALGEEFAGGDRPVRAPGDDIGEGAAAIDPEPPLPFRRCLHAV